jgi:multiple sugar transport system substrate-binding protein
MKSVFAGAAAIVALLGLILHATRPDLRSEVPVLYWVIDPNPVRGEQIHEFHLWQISRGHCTTERIRDAQQLGQFRARRWSPAVRKAITEANDVGPGLWEASAEDVRLPLELKIPLAEMRLDAASNDLNKKVVQGVSGVAGDVIEAYSGGKQMQYLASAGMLADVTESATRLGFGPEKTYAALRPALFYQGRQYAFPRNPAQTMYWVNEDTFKKYGQPLPPSRWTLEEFERRGKAYVAAANPAGERQTQFFADRAIKIELRRSMGLSLFNETLTRSTLDDERNARLLELIRKWTYGDRILPSAADRASFDTAGGWGGSGFQLFKGGHYAMFACGRWALMLFRKFGKMELEVVEPPHAWLPNTLLSGGQTTVYRNSPHRELAELFLAYMADESYNLQIARSGDALPPNPAYAETEVFNRPPDYPNEWGCHEPWVKAAKEIAIVQSFSPFVLPVIVERIDNEAEEEVMNGRATPTEAARRAAERVNEEIARTVKESPALAGTFAELVDVQKRIEQYRSEGRPVPSEWLSNPFHRRLYELKGWSK